MTRHNPNVFLSYSYKDRHLADILVQRLRERDIDIWTDRQIEPGASWRDEIQEALERSNTFVILITPESLSSDWLNFELGVALSRAKLQEATVIPVLMEGATADSLPPLLRDRVYIDANGMEEPEVEEALRKALAS